MGEYTRAHFISSFQASFFLVNVTAVFSLGSLILSGGHLLAHSILERTLLLLNCLILQNIKHVALLRVVHACHQLSVPTRRCLLGLLVLNLLLDLLNLFSCKLHLISSVGFAILIIEGFVASVRLLNHLDQFFLFGRRNVCSFLLLGACNCLLLEAFLFLVLDRGLKDNFKCLLCLCHIEVILRQHGTKKFVSSFLAL